MHASQMLLTLECPVSITLKDCDGLSIAAELRKLKGKSYGKVSILQTTLQSHPNMLFMFNRALLKEEMRIKLELRLKASGSKAGETGKSYEDQVREAELAAAALIMDEEESTKKKKKKVSKPKDHVNQPNSSTISNNDRVKSKDCPTISFVEAAASSSSPPVTPAPSSEDPVTTKERSLSPVHCDR
jgi:hypothetical protein